MSELKLMYCGKAKDFKEFADALEDKYYGYKLKDLFKEKSDE